MAGNIFGQANCLPVWLRPKMHRRYTKNPKWNAQRQHSINFRSFVRCSCVGWRPTQKLSRFSHSFRGLISQRKVFRRVFCSSGKQVAICKCSASFSPTAWRERKKLSANIVSNFGACGATYHLTAATSCFRFLLSEHVRFLAGDATKVSAAVWLIAFVFCSFQFGLFVSLIPFQFDGSAAVRWMLVLGVKMNAFEMKKKNSRRPAKVQRARERRNGETEGEKKKREKFSMRSGVRNEFSRLLFLECWTNKLRLLKLWIILFLSEENGKKCLRFEYETGKKPPDQLSDATEAAIQTLIQINSTNLKSFNSYSCSAMKYDSFGVDILWRTFHQKLFKKFTKINRNQTTITTPSTCFSSSSSYFFYLQTKTGENVFQNWIVSPGTFVGPKSHAIG